MEIRLNDRGRIAATVVLAWLISATGSVAFAGVTSASIPVRAQMNRASLQYPAQDLIGSARTAPLTILPAASMPFPDLLAMNHTLDMRLDQVPQAPPTLDPQAIARDQAAVPLPSGSTTGAVILAVLGILASRKSILHFFQ